ncbi:MAG: choice-of-anchor M domain-containing protein [Pseudomonadota bacterium]
MLNMRHLPSFIFCVGAICAMSSDASAQLMEYSTGHGDIGIEYIEGATPVDAELELHWHIEGGTVDGTMYGDEEFEAEDLVAITSLKAQRPAGDVWDAIGNNGGDTFWFLPQSNSAADNADVPFLGLASEEMILDPANAGDPPINPWVSDLTWTFELNSGPGEFSIWQSDGVSDPDFFVSSAEGITTFTNGVGGHDHFNYGFTALGDYDIQITVSATHDNGTASTADDFVVSDSRSFAFSAVPEPSSFALLASLGLVGMMRRRR